MERVFDDSGEKQDAVQPYSDTNARLMPMGEKVIVARRIPADIRDPNAYRVHYRYSCQACKCHTTFYRLDRWYTIYYIEYCGH